MTDWDKRFLDLADHVSEWSKDPSTKVGAVIVNNKHHIMGVGYNGLPCGVDDLEERYANRETKLNMVVHAEQNAIVNAIAPVDNCTIYISSLPPCSKCAGLIINAGLQRVVFRKREIPQRWRDSVNMSLLMFKEAEVEVSEIEEENSGN